MSDGMRHLASMMEREPRFVAHHLARHRYAFRLTWEEQASLLGVDADGLVLVALCPTPRPGLYGLAALLEISEQFGADPDVLGRIVGWWG